MPPKPPLTHFLCLPLVTPTSRPQLQSSISRFTTEITTPNDFGIPPLPPKAVRPVGALHFTIGVMSLPTPERLEAACSFLGSLDINTLLFEAERSISPPSATPPSTTAPLSPDRPPLSPITLTLSGLHPMHTSTSTSSLYTHPTPPSSPHLLPLASALRSAFLNASFLLPDKRPLKLHATLINTIYARSARSGKKRWSKDSGKIDASALIARYADHEWVRDMRVERVAICEMGAKAVLGEGGEVVDQIYREVGSVGLP